ncbi:MAG: Gfo/Idh/MocA family protein [Dehalococcoidia bacterium]
MQAPVRVAVIGRGLIARRSHLPAFAAREDAAVTGVASGHLETARQVAAEFHVPHVYPNWEAAVADPSIDAVDICTPNALHAEIAVAAARAGKHVLVEKPMAVTLAEADAMIAAARTAGVVLMVAHNLRFAPAVAELKHLLNERTIGRVLAAHSVFMHAGPEETWGATSDWFWREETAGGGALLDLGVHMIDLLRWFVDRPVIEVCAMTARLLKPTFADDNAVVTMRFDGDVLASMQTSWTARPFLRHQITILGELGHLAYDARAPEPLVVQLQAEPKPRRIVPLIPARSPLRSPFDHFVRCILDGTEPLTGGEEGRVTLAVTLAAYEAARTGRTAVPG